MKYFLVTVDKNYTAPVPIGWYGVLDRKSLKEKKFYQMQKHLLFYIENQMQTVFTDIIIFPCYLVSKLVKDIISCYDPFIKFSRVIFYDRKKKQGMTYYLPFFYKMEAEEKRYEEGKQKREIILEKKELERHVVLEVNTSFETLVFMRMDLVESILRRGVVGIGVEEIE